MRRLRSLSSLLSPVRRHFRVPLLPFRRRLTPGGQTGCLAIVVVVFVFVSPNLVDESLFRDVRLLFPLRKRERKREGARQRANGR